MKKLFLLAVLIAGFTFPACAACGPGYFKLSLWDYISFAIPNNISNIQGVDLGIGSTTHDITGFQWDIIWAESQYLTGVSWSWGISKTVQAQGWQWAFVNMTKEIAGFQSGFVNMSHDMTGLALGGVNLSSRSMVGAQIGFYNQAEYVNGLQLGVVNYAKYIYGLQLGLFNIAENGYLPIMVLVNGRF